MNDLRRKHGMVKTLVVFLDTNGAVHLKEYPGLYPSELGIYGNLKAENKFFKNLEEGIRGINKALDQTSK